MPVITLPDGSQRQFEQPVSVMDVAADIGPGLAKATLAGEVDGTLVDAAHRIEDDATLRIITSRDEEGLEVIRHSTAHLLAQAASSRRHPSISSFSSSERCEARFRPGCCRRTSNTNRD